MRRMGLAVICAIVVTVLLVPQSAMADKPRRTCAPGFNLGALTVEQWLGLPGTQRGLADGFYTVPEIHAFFEATDQNDNDLLCFQDIYSIAGENPNPASDWPFAYNIVDDNASNP
jgi:hypothetical protein